MIITDVLWAMKDRKLNFLRIFRLWSKIFYFSTNSFTHQTIISVFVHKLIQRRKPFKCEFFVEFIINLKKLVKFRHFKDLLKLPQYF